MISRKKINELELEKREQKLVQREKLINEKLSIVNKLKIKISKRKRQRISITPVIYVFLSLIIANMLYHGLIIVFIKDVLFSSALWSIFNISTLIICVVFINLIVNKCNKG